MFVDHDSNNKVSILEISQEESYIITEALIRFATNPIIPASDRERAKKIAYLISVENEDTKNGNE